MKHILKTYTQFIKENIDSDNIELLKPQIPKLNVELKIIDERVTEVYCNSIKIATQITQIENWRSNKATSNRSPLFDTTAKTYSLTWNGSGLSKLFNIPFSEERQPGGDKYIQIKNVHFVNHTPNDNLRFKGIKISKQYVLDLLKLIKNV
jgi:hypothetical protein